MKLKPLVSNLSLFDISGTLSASPPPTAISIPAPRCVGDEQIGKALYGADIVIIPAGVPKKPGRTCDDLFKINSGIVNSLCENIAKYCPNALVNMLTDPVNSTIPISAEVFKKAGPMMGRSCLSLQYSNVVRAKSFFSGKANVPVADVNIPVGGGHSGLTILPQSHFTYPAATALSLALQQYINSDNPSHGQKIHTHILKTGFQPNINICIKLLILHLKSHCLKYARKVFDEMPQRTVSAYNYMISGYLKQEQVEKSLGMVRKMVASNEKLDGFTFSMILKACTLGNNVYSWHSCSAGKQVHGQILKSGVEFDDVLSTALVNYYVRSDLLIYARTVFDKMLEKNVICSTSLITGYMNQGAFQSADNIFRRTIEKDVVVFNAMIEGYSKLTETAWRSLELFIDMQRLCFCPTISTLVSVIGACSLLAAFETGQQVQTQIMKTEYFEDIRIGSALIDMYSKCGRIEDAHRVFDHMPLRNVFSWTSLIDGYGKNGYPHEAIECFTRMQEDHHIKPNYVTFLAVLSACGHAGLVAKGKELFESMERTYSLKPKMEHYACMVDLLGRAGSLQEAWDLVNKMPDKPNSDVWAALLSSSRLHGDLEMARVAGREIFKLNPHERPGAYLALSNTLADVGSWDNVSEVRELMKVRGVSKNTGCSWVGADAAVN